MKPSVADFVIRRLHAWGVRRIFGYPGDGINGLIGAIDRAGDSIELIQTRHEELAAFMACAHAKFTGEVGVCLATSGPGAIHLLNGLYDAAMDHQPVVAIVGQQAQTALGSDYQQEVDLVSLFKDVAHHFVQMCTTPSAARHLVDRAVRIAAAERAVTCLIFPNDLQIADYAEPERVHGSVFSGIGYTPPKVVPHEQDIDRAVGVLDAGERVAMLIGAGALGATDEVIAVADKLGAGLAKALLGKAAVPDDLPWVTGSIGLLGTEPSDALMKECDTLLMVGTSFPYSEWLPEPGKARAVQIDIAPRMLSVRYPAEVNLVGDAAETLRLILPRLRPRSDTSWRQDIEERVRKWRVLLEKRAQAEASPINPQYVFWELSPRLPERCIVTADSGSAANWFARDLVLRRGMMASLSGNLATMGPGVPYAIAAKLAHPDRPVIACVGDGAMQMNGINGLITIARDWKRWRDPRLVVLVLANGDLNQVSWEQRVMAGDPKFPRSQDVPDMSYAAYAEMLGLVGLTMREKADVVPIWETALAAEAPVIVEARTDPEVPPLPPHITFAQASNYLGALLKGDPAGWQAAKRSLAQLAAPLRRTDDGS